MFHEFLAATISFTCSGPIKLLGNLSRHTLAILVSRVNVVLFFGDLTMVIYLILYLKYSVFASFAESVILKL